MLGFVFAFLALIGWGFGDFFIQRTIRKTSVTSAICYIGLFAGVALLPFVWHDIPLIWASTNNLYLLGGLALLTLVCTIIEFIAFGEGKIAILEPVLSTELPITVILGIAIFHETLSLWQAALMVTAFVGIALIVTVNLGHLRHHHVLIEKGTLLALASVVGLAIGNVWIAVASRTLSPLLTIWSSFLFIGLVTLVYLIICGRSGQLLSGFRKHKRLVLAEGFFDTFGWVAFGYATTYTTLALATTISEGYVVLTVVLGIFYNKEKLLKHQMLGLPIALTAIILLAHAS